MDLFQASKFFDTQYFDQFNFALGDWTLKSLKGQLKKTDSFVEIWNRPTRKRILTCAPGQEPTSPVVRVPNTGEVFMVGAAHKDSWDGYYRFIAGLHLVQGAAVLRRRAPAGPSNDPGWAVETVVMTTFADAELRSADENQDREIQHYGSFFVFLPANTPVLRNDTVEVLGRTYFVLEWYYDAGLISARATVEPDARVDFVYISKGTEVYNIATQTNTVPETSYNVTGRFKPRDESEQEENVLRKEAEVKILKSWIGVTPKINDVILYAGLRYEVEEVDQNALQDEWYLKVKI